MEPDRGSRTREWMARRGRGIGGAAPFPLKLVYFAHSGARWENFVAQTTNHNKKQKTLRFEIPPASIFRSIQVNSGKLTFQCVFVVVGLWITGGVVVGWGGRISNVLGWFCDAADSPALLRFMPPPHYYLARSSFVTPSPWLYDAWCVLSTLSHSSSTK